MEIRSALQSDYAAFVELNSEIQAMHVENEPELFKTGGVCSIEAYQKFISDPDLRIFIGYNEGTALGYAFCEIWRQPETDLSHAVDYLYLRHMVVRQSERGKGSYGFQTNRERLLMCS